MQLEEEKILLKVRPSVVVIFIGIFGIIFFGLFAYKLLTIQWVFQDNSSVATNKIVQRTFQGFFGIAAAGCFLMLLSIKSVVMTTQHLIIKRPMLFWKTTILLDDVSHISEREESIATLNRSQFITWYSGSKMIIVLSAGKKVSFSSIELGGNGYSDLKKKLDAYLRVNNKLVRKH